MRTIEVIETTTDSSTYKKAMKIYNSKYHIHCPICPYHKGENYGRRVKRNWKKYRDSQWLCSSMDFEHHTTDMKGVGSSPTKVTN